MSIQHLHSVAACIGDLTTRIARSVEQQQCTFKGTYALQVTRDRGIQICMYLYTGSFLFRDRCFTVVLLTAIDLAFRYSWTNSRGSCRAYRSWNKDYKKVELFVLSFVKSSSKIHSYLLSPWLPSSKIVSATRTPTPTSPRHPYVRKTAHHANTPQPRNYKKPTDKSQMTSDPT